jgi:hypothetical protein
MEELLALLTTDFDDAEGWIRIVGPTAVQDVLTGTDSAGMPMARRTAQQHKAEM